MRAKFTIMNMEKKTKTLHAAELLMLDPGAEFELVLPGRKVAGAARFGANWWTNKNDTTRGEGQQMRITASTTAGVLLTFFSGVLVCVTFLRDGNPEVQGRGTAESRPACTHEDDTPTSKELSAMLKNRTTIMTRKRSQT
jgi:hypothetical protein